MESPFYVPPLLHTLGGLVHRHRDLWFWLGRLESSLLADEIAPHAVQKPIYVCGSEL